MASCSEATQPLFPTPAPGASRTAYTVCRGPSTRRRTPGATRCGRGANSRGVIYELHIGTFTAVGTLAAAIQRLEHLVALGIDFVEIMPVNGFNGSHN